MTDYERKQITQLQQADYGYKRIASALGLPVNGVKTYCRRHPVVIHVCLQCGTPVPQAPHRKQKKFCSDRCRTNWWNAHRDQVQRKTFHKCVCRNCGKEFQSYGCDRRFCSRECYYESNRREVIANG
nr:MAG TPA: DNA gyrase subunit A [Caudoviricetes sp.]